MNRKNVHFQAQCKVNDYRVPAETIPVKYSEDERGFCVKILLIRWVYRTTRKQWGFDPFTIDCIVHQTPTNMAKIVLKKVKESSGLISGLKPARKLKLKKVAFKFKILPNPVIYNTQVSLKSADKIKVSVIRNPGAFTKIVTKPETSSSKDGDWNCSTQRWSGEMIRQEPVILNPNMNEIYPGAIFDYKSIDNGTYKRLPYTRKPITLWINRNQASVATLTVNNPSAASVAQAMSKISGSIKGGGAAVTFGESFGVMSEEQLFMSTGGSGYYLGFGGSHSVDYTSKSRTHKFYIKLFQEYYSILIDDTSNEPSDFFVMKDENAGDKDALDPAKTDPNWVVVSSVKYGRILNLMFESDESYEEYGVDVNAYANFLVAGGSANFSLRQKNFLKRTSVRMVAFGGNPALTGQILTAGDQAGLKKAINNYFKGSSDEVPISYTLATLDGDNIGVKMISDFTARQCAPAAEKFEVRWVNVVAEKADDASGDEDIRAMLRVRAWDGNGKEILDVDKKNKAILDAEQTKKKTGFPFPIPWTFAKGSEDHPLQLGQNEIREIDQRIIFRVDKSDKAAKVGLRADVLEYDSTSANDDFADDVKSFKFSEIGDVKKVKLICDHEGSRIAFNLEIRPVYD